MQLLLTKEKICDYLALNNPDAAIALFEKIRQKCKTVAQFPNMDKNYNRLAPSLRGFIVDNYAAGAQTPARPATEGSLSYL